MQSYDLSSQSSDVPDTDDNTKRIKYGKQAPPKTKSQVLFSSCCDNLLGQFTEFDETNQTVNICKLDFDDISGIRRWLVLSGAVLLCSIFWLFGYNYDGATGR